jgi:hypothetical protein
MAILPARHPCGWAALVNRHSIPALIAQIWPAFCNLIMDPGIHPRIPCIPFYLGIPLDIWTYHGISIGYGVLLVPPTDDDALNCHLQRSLSPRSAPSRRTFHCVL